MSKFCNSDYRSFYTKTLHSFPYLTSRSEHSYENVGMEFYKRNLSSPTRSLLTSPDAVPLSHKQFQPITSTSPIWVVTRHQYGISALVSQMSFGGETSGGVVNSAWLFSQITTHSKPRLCNMLSSFDCT